MDVKSSAQDLLAFLGIALAFLGIAISCVSTWLTYLTYFNPKKNLLRALKNNAKWRQIDGTKPGIKIYRHDTLSGFSISIDMDEEVAKDFSEPWLDDLQIADFEHNRSMYVKIYFNGILSDSLLFVSFDGGRYFIPAPKTRPSINGYEWYFDETQVALCDIVGRNYAGHISFPEIFSTICSSTHNYNRKKAEERIRDLSPSEFGEKIEAFKRVRSL